MVSKPRALEEWLQAKLDDPWGGDNISTLLTADQLSEIGTRWDSFDPQIRTKILIGVYLVLRCVFGFIPLSSPMCLCLPYSDYSLTDRRGGK